MKTKLACIALVGLMSTVSFAQKPERQKVYQLQEGEKIMVQECGFGAAITENRYTLLVEKPNGESVDYYIVTPEKRYGPYGDMIPKFQSEKGSISAIIASPRVADEKEKVRSIVIFNDGKSYGEFVGYANVAFNENGSEWAIVALDNDYEANKVQCTVQFKGGKAMKGDVSENVIFAEKGNASMRMRYTNTNDIYKTEAWMSNGKKIGPFENLVVNMNVNGSSYVATYTDTEGKNKLDIDGKITDLGNDVSLMDAFSPDGKDAALVMKDEQMRNYILYKNGTTSPKFAAISSASLFYDVKMSRWGWIAAEQDNLNVRLFFSDGKKSDVLHTLATDSSAVQYGYYVDGGVTISPNKEKWVVSYCAPVVYDENNPNPPAPECKIITPDASGNLTVKSDANAWDFDTNNRLYSIESKPSKKDPEVYEYTLKYPNGKSYDFGSEYPADIQFIPGTNKWYMLNYDNVLLLSDGSSYPNAFDVRYVAAEGALYWGSLEEDEIYRNKKVWK